MKKLIYTLLTLSILFTIGCDDKKEESVDQIIGTWTLSAVCGFEDENCSGTCTDATEEWLEEEGGFSMTFTFSEGGVGTFTYSEGADSFSWSGSGPYTLTGDELDGQSITVNLSGNSITWNVEDDVCIQFTLTK